MSMQLFSFGHPCEHQLRRTCIGGSSCPLNGYPDIWCCSYIKGKINFKRDKPCEGPRCRWGFTHPTQQQFDAVTQVLNESRPIAAKIDEADERELLSFHMDNPHLVDTVQCALHMMRNPPSSCARRVGQLLACAAVKSGEAKVFMQLLKTMKKPVDSYILGAYAYLTQGNPPTGPAASHGGKEGGKGKKDKSSSAGNKKEDVVEELKNDMTDLMNAALSQGGHLVDREDQHELQAIFIQALRQYSRGNKRRQEQLEAALAKFGNRQVPKDLPKPPPPPLAAAPTTTTAAAAATPVAADRAVTEEGRPPVPQGPPPSTTTTATTTTTITAAAAVETRPTATAAETLIATTPSTAGATPKSVAASTPQQRGQSTPAAPVEPLLTATSTTKQQLPHHSSNNSNNNNNNNNNTNNNNNNNNTNNNNNASAGAPGTPAAGATAATLPTPLQQPQAAPPPPPQPQPITGISRVASLRPAKDIAAERRYDPIRTDLPLPDVFILGGLFNLSPNPVNCAPLGPASTAVAATTTRSVSYTCSPNSNSAHLSTIPNAASNTSPGPAMHHHQQQQHQQQQQQQQQLLLNHSASGHGFGQKIQLPPPMPMQQPQPQQSYIPVPFSQQQQQQQQQHLQMLSSLDGSNNNSTGPSLGMISHHQPQQQQPPPQVPMPQATVPPMNAASTSNTAAVPASAASTNSTRFIDSIFGNLSTQPVFDNLDTNRLFRDFDEGWAS